jgi:hypothetical protein
MGRDGARGGAGRPRRGQLRAFTLKLVERERTLKPGAGGAGGAGGRIPAAAAVSPILVRCARDDDSDGPCTSPAIPWIRPLGFTLGHAPREPALGAGCWTQLKGTKAWWPVV